MSVIVEVAEAVKTELNGHEFSQEFTAERHYRPLFDLKDMKDLHVTVVPKGVTLTTAGRDRAQHDIQVDIAVQKKVTASLDEADVLMGLVEEIADFFRLRRLVEYSGAVWVATENSPVFAPEHLEQLGQFTSVLTLTFRVLR